MVTALLAAAGGTAPAVAPAPAQRSAPGPAGSEPAPRRQRPGAGWALTTASFWSGRPRMRQRRWCVRSAGGRRLLRAARPPARPCRHAPPCTRRALCPASANTRPCAPPEPQLVPPLFERDLKARSRMVRTARGVALPTGSFSGGGWAGTRAVTGGRRCRSWLVVRPKGDITGPPLAEGAAAVVWAPSGAPSAAIGRHRAPHVTWDLTTPSRRAPPHSAGQLAVPGQLLPPLPPGRAGQVVI